ncbi:MAG: hypothetical protein WBD02_11690 [Acidimicrobiia bacterium]
MTRAMVLNAPARRSAPVSRPKLVAVPRRAPRSPRVLLIAAAITMLGGTAVTQSLLAQTQIELDRLERTYSLAVQDRANLRLRVAELQAPSRVVSAARDRLGMIEPQTTQVIVDIGPNGAPVQGPK